MSEKLTVGSAVDLGPSGFPRKAFQGLRFMSQAEGEAKCQKIERIAELKEKVIEASKVAFRTRYSSTPDGTDNFTRWMEATEALIKAEESS